MRDARSNTWTGQIVGVFVVLAVILWFIQMRKAAPMQLLERRDCQKAYASVRTAAESAAVDLRQPLGADRPDSLAQTCGDLRKAGRL